MSPNPLRLLLPYLNLEDGEGSRWLRPQAATTFLFARSTTGDYWCRISVIQFQDRNYFFRGGKVNNWGCLSPNSDLLQEWPSKHLSWMWNWGPLWPWHSDNQRGMDGKEGRKTDTNRTEQVMLNDFKLTSNKLLTVFMWLNVWPYTQNDSNRPFSTMCVLFVNVWAGTDPSVRAADAGNDQTENPEDWRD